MLEKGREKEAWDVVYRLHHASTTTARAAAEEEFVTMRDTIRVEMLSRSRNISDLFATSAMFRRTLVACSVQIFGQFTGINGDTHLQPEIISCIVVLISNS